MHASDKFFFSASLCVQLKSLVSSVVQKTLSSASDGNFYLCDSRPLHVMLSSTVGDVFVFFWFFSCGDGDNDDMNDENYDDDDDKDENDDDEDVDDEGDDDDYENDEN